MSTRLLFAGGNFRKDEIIIINVVWKYTGRFRKENCRKHKNLTHILQRLQRLHTGQLPKCFCFFITGYHARVK
ncbi:hypothetical protein ASU35_16875 [Acetivibrio ethanolgignens]|uniref:Uncharacterized protein n=1 Tax=Acetivibrio ethanolgignens TaxID=290052 RepID=A0A0V8QIX3_9FIRM|nr:hypothetical protein ASU35_16875 [Acetivibrio ethanolgignens]